MLNKRDCCQMNDVILFDFVYNNCDIIFISNITLINIAVLSWLMKISSKLLKMNTRKNIPSFLSKIK